VPACRQAGLSSSYRDRKPGQARMPVLLAADSMTKLSQGEGNRRARRNRKTHIVQPRPFSAVGAELASAHSAIFSAARADLGTIPRRAEASSAPTWGKNRACLANDVSAAPTPGAEPQDRIALPPPCFNFALCGARAAVEKRGRAVCRRCAAQLAGREYPLRAPSKKNIYRSVIEAVEALDMYEPRRAAGDASRFGGRTARGRRQCAPRYV
jgi:hypothetical protein